RPRPGHRRLLERPDAAEVRLHQLPQRDPPRPRARLHRAVLLRALRLRLARRDRRERALHPPGAHLGPRRAERLRPPRLTFAARSNENPHTTETRTIQPFPAARTALVTGAGAPRGIGRRVVRKLVAEGWSVAAADLDGAAVEEFAAELTAEIPADSGQKVIGVAVDISDQASVDAAYARIDAEMPQLVALVNLAGIPSPHAFLDITSEIWDRVMGVNGKGT